MNDNEQSIQKPRDFRLYIFVLQIVACIIVLIFAVILRFFGGKPYSRLSRRYKKEISQKTEVSEVIDKKEKSTDKSVSESLIINTCFDNSDKDTDINATAEPQSLRVSTENNGDNNTIMWPVKGTVTSKFGDRTDPINGIDSVHRGVDIAVETGTKVKAAFSGTVADFGYNKSYGNYIIIKHSDNFSTLYAHCKKTIKSKGERINKGDVIAYSGNTGRTTGPHLHFEIRINGSAVDPLTYLS